MFWRKKVKTKQIKTMQDLAYQSREEAEAMRLGLIEDSKKIKARLAEFKRQHPECTRSNETSRIETARTPYRPYKIKTIQDLVDFRSKHLENIKDK